MPVRFKTHSEFEKWQLTVGRKARLRIAASMGERVVVDGDQVLVPTTIRKSRTVRRVRRCLALGFLGLMLAGLQGMALCEAALWGLSQTCK